MPIYANTIILSALLIVNIVAVLKEGLRSYGTALTVTMTLLFILSELLDRDYSILTELVLLAGMGLTLLTAIYILFVADKKARQTKTK